MDIVCLFLIFTLTLSSASVIPASPHVPDISQRSQLSDALGALGNLGSGASAGASWLHLADNLMPQLDQVVTNGLSVLGTLNAPSLSPWLPGSPLPNGRPWGTRTAEGTNKYHDVPVTGTTRYYEFNVSYQTIAPDGVEVNAVLVNGQFPGPTIEANWGDWIEVVVNNHLQHEGTSMHWHGLLQRDTPWYDGTPGVHQCPIAPGESFTYRFRADLYGTSWWHSHYSAQYAAGAHGPLIVYGPCKPDYDIDLGPVILQDWYHDSYHAILNQVMAPSTQGGPPPPSNNVLNNGKMNYPCEQGQSHKKCTPNAGVAKFQFRSGKRYRLRLMNAGAEAIQKFSIDNHMLTVIMHDFVDIQPYETNVVQLGVGQRVDIIVTATGRPNDLVWMRSEVGPSALSGGCSVPDGISPTGLAAVYYEHADTSAMPETQSSITQDELVYCGGEPLSQSIPLFPIEPPAEPDVTLRVDITYGSNGTNFLYFINNSSYRTDYNDPMLFDAKNGNVDFPEHYNTYNLRDSRSTRLIVRNFAFASAHPMHMHGHNMYILAEGYGEWDGTVMNPENPSRRDVQMLGNARYDGTPSYLVVQLDNDNPGIWPFHCHVAWHVSQGFYINLLERPDSIRDDMMIPSDDFDKTCDAWAAWTDNHIPGQIDSGL